MRRIKHRTQLILFLASGLLAVAAPVAHPAHNASGCNTIAGTGSGETIIGSDACDDIFAGGGGDRVEGRIGKDDVHGEGGDDRVYGQAYDDQVFGGTGNDSISGDQDDDKVQDEAIMDSDVACGQDGWDYVDVRDGSANDLIYTSTNDAYDYDAESELSGGSCPV